ncbi:hypothetical protein EJ110_NYTH14743 [Nymphaea thermarum]|nr:hypothetical protein EJ110_NYTH14743 [Nymphaea thermarum]
MRIRNRSTHLSLLLFPHFSREGGERLVQAKEEGAAQTEAPRQEQKKEAASGAALHLRPPSSQPPTSGSLPLLQKAAGETARDSHTALLKPHTQEVGRLEKREGARDERNWSSVEATEKDYSQDGRWHEEKSAFPLKKRKNLEWAFDGGEDDGDNGAEDESDDDECKQKKKKAKAVEKKWRCTRMNGRGWRCSKPTLVGYSLCEHHLGKGRRIKTINTLAPQKQQDDNPEAANGSKKNKKKEKEIVKARSMNSLLLDQASPSA